MSVTVPAWTIEALGGLRAEDPPIYRVVTHDGLCAELPQSAPTLLVLLARAYGQRGSAMEVPRLRYVCFGPDAPTTAPGWFINGWRLEDLPESIQALTDPVEALAAIFEWTAWLHRLGRLQWRAIHGTERPYVSKPLAWQQSDAVAGWDLRKDGRHSCVYPVTEPGVTLDDPYGSLKAVVAHLEARR